MKKIRSLRQKKGFTMIELIVVIAIIGILLALIIPNVNRSDKPSVGKSYAKDFYYKSQSFFSRKKLAGDTAITGDTIFYFEVNQNGVKLVSSAPDASSYGTASGGSLSPCSSASGTMKTLLEDYARDINKEFSSFSYDGTLYAVVDNAYRVKIAYWTDGAIGELNGATFTNECILSTGVYACAYPPRLSSPEGGTQIMFQYS